MKNIFEAAKNHPLFMDTSYDDFEKALDCLLVKEAFYQKNDIIWLVGEPVQFMGLLMSGSVKVTKNDADGTSIIISEVCAPSFLGEIGIFAGLETFPVAVQACENCHVFFLDGSKITSVCTQACQFHKTIYEHLLRSISKKALMLDQKVELLSKRTIREKIFFFFDIQSGTAKKFTSPYNREEMARYLCVNRSALSDELSKMRNEGLIRYRRNEFEIL